jgi:glycosyltransferase involved in cell wall biosynthesis
MNFLFIHQNFPGQFKFLAPALAQEGHHVVALTLQKVESKSWNGVQLLSYKTARGSSNQIHPWVSDFETKIIRAEACFKAALKMKSEGFNPDIIIAHHGWGESLFLKDVWPNAKLGIYCEFFYHPEGADVGFDPEFPGTDNGEVCRLRLKNLNNLLHFEIADAGISPTYWQASTFPEVFREKITVVHDGIDTETVIPKTNISLKLKKKDGSVLSLKKDDEIITFVNRNLEPYRGFHSFMRSLPDLLKQRPNACVLIVGSDEVGYGAKAQKEKHGADTWKDVYINEVQPQISDLDWARVHFLGQVPYQYFIPLLQLSTVHVYLTYPFVLSWSLLEAMSAGCAIVASDTQPLHEAIKHKETGLLVDFFSHPEITQAICGLLESSKERTRLGLNARKFAIENYDLKSVCLPKQLDWVRKLSNI